MAERSTRTYYDRDYRYEYDGPDGCWYFGKRGAEVYLGAFYLARDQLAQVQALIKRLPRMVPESHR